MKNPRMLFGSIILHKHTGIFFTETISLKVIIYRKNIGTLSE